MGRLTFKCTNTAVQEAGGNITSYVELQSIQPEKVCTMKLQQEAQKGGHFKTFTEL